MLPQLTPNHVPTVAVFTRGRWTTDEDFAFMSYPVAAWRADGMAMVVKMGERSLAAVDADHHFAGMAFRGIIPAPSWAHDRDVVMAYLTEVDRINRAAGMK
jgi:hypothetical protein